MSQPRLLDLFCGAGGAARGYQQAGFYVVGVDIKPQPRYIGEEFVQADALEYLAAHGQEFDAVHASPPCQGYSIMRNLPWLREKVYPLLIQPTRELCAAIGNPYVIENVMGAHLEAGWLCGQMFGRPFFRHRYFDTSFYWLAPEHPRHWGTVRNGRTLGAGARDIVTIQARPTPGQRRGLNIRDGMEHVAFSMQAIVPMPAGHSGWSVHRTGELDKTNKGAMLEAAKEAMGIDWMKREELVQAIPPCYTEFIGRALREEI
jgi:DNA (cytosine-5)-methyltransferase 1